MTEQTRSAGRVRTATAAAVAFLGAVVARVATDAAHGSTAAVLSPTSAPRPVLPRGSWEQSRAGTPTTRSGLVPGDIVLSDRGGHVVLHIGGGRVIHAPRPGTRVTIAPLPPSSQVVAYRHIGS
ncbi:hypothetical protein [Streptomyces sp. ME19-01-6]|uniref:hypothetical protein n=1 Tax=Streptomyces sp. ME19-01-6 TaxID=3028686 RepID=UPI0029B09181|nr:hypothetical protein [Streptomyces sp. ME19-01-6]MDX3228384.1 hypothetical protein [Streptomyces sp. ME19-01-6]